LRRVEEGRDGRAFFAKDGVGVVSGKKRVLRMVWTCSDYCHHQHKWRITAYLCGRAQFIAAFLWRKFSDKGQAVVQKLDRLQVIHLECGAQVAWLNVPVADGRVIGGRKSESFEFMDGSHPEPYSPTAIKCQSCGETINFFTDKVEDGKLPMRTSYAGQ